MEFQFSKKMIPLAGSLLAMGTALCLFLIDSTSLLDFLALSLHLEGMALVVSAFMEAVISPPSQMDWWEWIFTPSQDAFFMVCRQPVFYGGLVCLLLSRV
ncbi:MAG: hypothetical protein HY645_10175 [Acidobacteria bacterium]|nr:hypothetical protein [Acidobacteriota bacterium]